MDVLEQDVAQKQRHLDLADALLGLRVGQLEAGASQIDMPAAQPAELADAKAAEAERVEDRTAATEARWCRAVEVVIGFPAPSRLKIQKDADSTWT
jgi:hypothetical protein